MSLGDPCVWRFGKLRPGVVWWIGLVSGSSCLGMDDRGDNLRDDSIFALIFVLVFGLFRILFLDYGGSFQLRRTKDGGSFFLTKKDQKP